jgi:hypothetical protein
MTTTTKGPTLLQKRAAFVRAFEAELGAAGKRAAMAAWDALYGHEELEEHAKRVPSVIVPDATDEERQRVRALLGRKKGRNAA